MDTDIFYIRQGETIYHVKLHRPSGEYCKLTDVETGKYHLRSPYDLLWRLASSDEFTKIEDQFAAHHQYGHKFR